MRSHYCTQVNKILLDQIVIVCGWINNRRDHGGVIFLDVRDISGLVQVIYEPEYTELFALAETLRREFVVRITGTVRMRPEAMVNPKMETGYIEILGSGLEILNKSKPLPFLPDDYQHVSDDLRYRYRYLDLRRNEMQHNLRLRHNLISCIRSYLNADKFIDIETPMLTKSTPEGARDYLVPSRVYPGEFFALPQSPQLFKQLLMMSGFDKYYQIVRCFRDEDLRADRQPEFTQLDIEMSFVNETHIINLIENLLHKIFKDILGVDLPKKLPQISYADAISRFGTDKPDLRITLELVDIADLVIDCSFIIFSQAAKRNNHRVVALRLPQGCNLLSRKALDQYITWISSFGASGLAYIKVNKLEPGCQDLQSPILKFLSAQCVQAILERTAAETSDIIFFCAGPARVVNESMGALRVKLGHDCQQIKNSWSLVWIIDWPMFELDDNSNELKSMHHPFTSPSTLSLEALEQAPLTMSAKAYDIVINGFEIGGGSIRIHLPQFQRAVFKALGLGEEEANEKFGFLIDALEYGCPPHGGIALGIDRLAMLFANANTIRDVIAFPKTQSSACLLTNAPSIVKEQQLYELGICLVPIPK